MRTHLSQLERIIHQTRNQMMLANAIQQFARAFGVTILACILLVILDRVFDWEMSIWIYCMIVGLAMPLAMSHAIVHRPTLMDAARRLDEVFPTRNQIGSAWELHSSLAEPTNAPPNDDTTRAFQNLLMEQAQIRITHLSARRTVRYDWQKIYTVDLVFMVLATSAYLLIPSLSSYLPQSAEATRIALLQEERARAAALIASAANELTNQEETTDPNKPLDPINDENQADSDDEVNPIAAQAAKTLQQLADQLTSAEDDTTVDDRDDGNPTEAIADAASTLQQLAEDLDEAAEQDELAHQEVMEQFTGLDDLPSPTSSDTSSPEIPRQLVDELREALRDGDLPRAMDEIDQIQKELKDMSPDERESIAQLLEQASRDLQPPQESQTSSEDSTSLPNTTEDVEQPTVDSQDRPDPESLDQPATEADSFSDPKTTGTTDQSDDSDDDTSNSSTDPNESSDLEKDSPDAAPADSENSNEAPNESSEDHSPEENSGESSGEFSEQMKEWAKAIRKENEPSPSDETQTPKESPSGDHDNPKTESVQSNDAPSELTREDKTEQQDPNNESASEASESEQDQQERTSSTQDSESENTEHQTSREMDHSQESEEPDSAGTENNTNSEPKTSTTSQEDDATAKHESGEQVEPNQIPEDDKDQPSHGSESDSLKPGEVPQNESQSDAQPSPQKTAAERAEDLRESLEKLDNLKRSAEQNRELSDDMREKAQQLWEQMSPEERQELQRWAAEQGQHNDDPTTSGQETTPEDRRPPSAASDDPNATDPNNGNGVGSESSDTNAPIADGRSKGRDFDVEDVDARTEEQRQRAANQVLSEWLDEDDLGSVEPKANGASNSPRRRAQQQAAQAIERALNDEGVSPRYRELLRRWSKRLARNQYQKDDSAKQQPSEEKQDE